MRSWQLKASLTIAAITTLLCHAPARADLVDPGDPSIQPFIIQQGDFSTVGLNYYGTLAGVDTTVKFTDTPVFIYTGQNGQTNPGTIEQPYDAAQGGNSPNPGQAWGNDYYFQMGSSYNGAGCNTGTTCNTYADPGPNPPGGTTSTWDITISDLNTALNGQTPVFYFWMNETGNNGQDTLDGIDELAWGSITLVDTNASDGITAPITFYLTNDLTASQTGGPDPSVATCNVDPNDPYGLAPPPNPGCTTTNQNGTAEDTNADSRWTYVSGKFCVNPGTGAIVHYGGCSGSEGVTIENNLGVNQAAFAIWSDDLNAILANGGCDPQNPAACWDTMQVDVRLSMLDNGYEVLAIAGAATEPPTFIPEPSSLAILGAALAGLGVWRRRRRIAA